MNALTFLTLAALLTGSARVASAAPLSAGQAYEAELAADPAVLKARAGAAARLGTSAVGADAAARMGALLDAVLLTGELPPPPGEETGGSLPPPPGENPRRNPGRLPPPPGEDPLPRPTYPGGPLPRGDGRLENAERTYDEEGAYLGYWNGARGYNEVRGQIVVDAGDRAEQHVLTLKSEETLKQTHFVRKSDGRVYWYPRQRLINTETRRLVVNFVNRGGAPLLPWERETFVFSFKGDRSRNGGVELESADGAYRYEYAYRFSAGDALTQVVEMTAREKLLTPADADGVTMTLEADGQGGLKLVVTDRRASYYAGESLQLAYAVKKDVAWRIDPTVLEATTRSPQTKVISAGSGGTAVFEIPLGNPGRGAAYYLDGWSFQRFNSAVSRPGWIGRRGDERRTIKL